MAAALVASAPAVGLASGAHPTSTFPNCYSAAGRHLGSNVAEAKASYAPPCAVSALDQLRQAIREENWERHFETRNTQICMRPEWSANEERCAGLQQLITAIQAKHVLEIGSFCGVGALAMAEALPADGKVRALELDPFVVSFGQKYQRRSLAGHRIEHVVGSAQQGLKRLVQQSTTEAWCPFDFVVVDADKEGMQEYVDVLFGTPGLLSEDAVVCVDTTPYKGQMPKRYEKFGFPHRWQADSGEAAISEFKSKLMASPEMDVHESGNLLVLRKTQK